jgi:hypothetical protein
VGKVVAAPFVYFRSLPPLVQSLIIILLIVWKLPKLRDTILEILKAIGGKWEYRFPSVRQTGHRRPQATLAEWAREAPLEKIGGP